LITKIDLARYYDAIAEWVVPHVAGRPLTLVRCPEGVTSDCFFMKHSKVWAPAPLKRVRIQEKTKLGEYLIADDISAIVGLVQMGVLEIHTGIRCGAISSGQIELSSTSILAKPSRGRPWSTRPAPCARRWQLSTSNVFRRRPADAVCML